MRWLVMMSRWARNPPSDRRVGLVFGVIVLALVIWGVEALGLWPEWATAERMRMR